MYKQDFKIKRGETFIKDIIFKVKDELVDLTGYTAKSEIRPSLESNELIAEITCEITPKKGLVQLQLSKEQTSQIEAGKYFYDLCLTKDDVNTYYLQGRFIVDKYVTEPPNV
jgi:hypothetical protein